MKKIDKMNKLSRIVYGTWELLNNNSQDKAYKLLEYAISNGITTFDTAQVYSGGSTEKLLGKLKKEYPQIIIATKIPASCRPDNQTRVSEAYPKNSIREKIELSLKNLDLNCIDMMHLHNWNPNWSQKDIEHIFSELRTCRNEGLVSKIGVSLPNWMNETSQILTNPSNVDFLQVPINITEQENYELIIKPAKKNGIQILVRNIYGGSSLAKTYDESQIKDAFSYVQNLNEVDSIIIGMNSKTSIDKNLSYLK